MTRGAGPFRLVPLLLVVGWLGACAPAGDGGRVIVTSGFTDEVFVLGADAGELLRTVSVDPRPMDVDEPHGVAVSPDGSHWYVSVLHGDPTLWKFDARDDARVGVVRLGIPGAARIGITPDGRRAFVPDYWRSGGGRAGALAVVRLEDLEIEAAPTLCPAPHDAAVSPDGGAVAVTCSFGDEVWILDASSLEVRARHRAGPRPGPPGSPRYKPLNAVWSATGDTLYVTLNVAGEVIALHRGGDVLQRLDLGGAPMQIASAGEGKILVVPLRAAGAVSILETGPLREAARIAPPGLSHPHGVAVDRNGRRAFVSYEGTVESPGGVVALGLPDGEVLWRRETGRYTLGVAYAPPRP